MLLYTANCFIYENFVCCKIVSIKSKTKKTCNFKFNNFC